MVQVHERTLQGDFLMALLRDLVISRRTTGNPLKVGTLLWKFMLFPCLCVYTCYTWLVMSCYVSLVCISCVSFRLCVDVFSSACRSKKQRRKGNSHHTHNTICRFPCIIPACQQSFAPALALQYEHIALCTSLCSLQAPSLTFSFKLLYNPSFALAVLHS